MPNKILATNPFMEGLTAHFTEVQIRRLGAVCVGLAGAGGLGSNTAVHLVRSGIRRLVIIDFDRVAASNLNRQFYFSDQVGMKKVKALEQNLLRIHPELTIQTRDIHLDNNNIRPTFASCDVLVEALDGAREKKMMADTFAADPRHLFFRLL